MDFASRFRQFRVLCKHFFSRLFYNDLLKFEDQQRESQVVMLTLLAVAGGLVAHVAFEPFLLYGFYDMTAADIWRYEAVLLTFSMAITGIIAVASWDKLFLDPLDRVTLCPLPVSAGPLFFSKFFSLLAFVFAVTTIGNSAAVFIAAAEPADLLGSLFIGGWAHYAAIMAGSFFIFLVVALLQGLIMILFPPGLGKRVAVFVQMLLLFAFLSPFVWFPMLFRSLPALKAEGSAFFHFYPPLWFAGIFNRVIGVRDPLLDQAGRIGMVAITLVFMAYLLISPLCLRMFIRSNGAAPLERRRVVRFPAGKRFFAAIFLRHPIQVAVFSFFMQTLRRSREHKLRLTLFLALPISFLLSQFAYLILKKGFFGGALDSLLASMPLALHFFLIIGMRMAVAYPHTLQANFIFRISECGQLRYYVSGLRKALVGSVVIPPLLICFPLYLFFWEPGLALVHALYCLAIAMLLLELCFFNFHSIPFAAEHVPGKFKLRYYWPILLIGSYEYYHVFSSLGRSLQKNPRNYLVFFPLAALLYALLRLRQDRRMAGEQLMFEEEPEPAMLTLGLD